MSSSSSCDGFVSGEKRLTVALRFELEAGQRVDQTSQDAGFRWDDAEKSEYSYE